MEVLGHYDGMVENYEWVKNTQNDINDLMDQLRKEGAAEPTLIELEAQIEYLLFQCKQKLIDNFHLECEKDELNEKLNRILGFVEENKEL